MELNIYSGKFIVFEGLDGSGQSTETVLLTKYLNQNGYQSFATKEPTSDSKVAGKIEKVLEEKEKIAPIELQKLFARDRRWHLEEKIIPKLKEGKIVISDRYFFSSFAYGQAERIPLTTLYKLNKDFFLPDIVFFLDVGPKICLQRIESRGGEKALFEKKEKLEKVYQNYKKIFKEFKTKTNINFINGKRSIKEVFDEVKKTTYEILQSSQSYRPYKY